MIFSRGSHYFVANILNAEDRKELDKTLDHNYDIVVANILMK